VQRELEHLTRFYVAWQYYSAQVRSDLMYMFFFFCLSKVLPVLKHLDLKTCKGTGGMQLLNVG
jgi:hypothetical protein